MRKLKLFPKTFLCVFSLMAVIALISHILFYFLMPIVYTRQKEEAFQDIQACLAEELKGVSYDTRDVIGSMVSQYARQNQMGIFVYFAGETYNFMSNAALTEDRDSGLQEEVTSGWSVQGEAPELEYLQQDFYRKTDLQLYSGIRFETEGGEACFLVMFSTLQPVGEAKNAVVLFLPFTLLLALALSVIFALIYSRKITRPLSDISHTTERMKELDRSALCKAGFGDEIGTLSENINGLYGSLLATIDDLKKENLRVSEAEAAKLDFLRAASHELKTPVTALCGLLDNMIMGIGRYRDWETYLPVCRDMAGRFGSMIQEILDASKLNFSFENDPFEEISLRIFAEEILSPYLMIARTKEVGVDMDFDASFSAKIPVRAMEKVLSNIISNAVKYTSPQCCVRVYFKDRSIVVENECEPIPANVLSHIFEPFYRPDFSRSRSAEGENPNGGNGLGLYIAAKILELFAYQFSFEPFSDFHTGIDGMRFTIFFS